MFHLLKIEWLKLKNYRTFWVLSGLFLLSIAGINYICHQIQAQRPKDNAMADAILGPPYFRFPDVWHTVPYMSSFLLFIPGLLMIIFITNEYSFRTHRQNVIDGLSRSQFISVKMVLALLLALVSTVVVFITALLFGLLEEGSTLSFDKVEYLAYFFLQALSYTMVALLFGLLFKRSGLAVGIFFLYSVVLENFMAGLMNHYLNSTGYYLPLESAEKLIPFPFFRNMTRQFISPPPSNYLLVAALIYLALYYYFSKKKFETSDL